MKKIILVAALCLAPLAARADGPAPSNGWNWMASFAADGAGCVGYFGTLRCFWHSMDHSLTGSVYAGGAFPAPTPYGGTFKLAPNVAGGEADYYIVSVHGMDDAVWIREIQSGVAGGWGSIGAKIKGRPACGTFTNSYVLCAVQGLDDGIWTNAKVPAKGWIGWARVDPAQGGPKLDVRSSPAVVSRLGGGNAWALLYLGNATTIGRRELWLANDYGLGATKTTWQRLGDVEAAFDSDLNCPPSTLRGMWHCVARTVNNDVNVISIDFLRSPTGVIQRTIPKPANFPVTGTPTIALFQTTRELVAIGIRTTQNHFWLRAE